jgi:hypothetical protein
MSGVRMLQINRQQRAGQHDLGKHHREINREPKLQGNSKIFIIKHISINPSQLLFNPSLASHVYSMHAAVIDTPNI